MTVDVRTYRRVHYRTPTGWAVAEYGYVPSDYGDVATLTRRRYVKDRQQAEALANRWWQERSGEGAA